MSTPSGPVSVGRHLPWSRVPDVVHAWAAGVGGGAPDQIDDLVGGFSPGAAARLRFPSGTDLFIKAVGLSLNPESPEFHRREGRVSAALPPSPSWPRLLHTYDDGDWVALAFEAIDGRTPAIPWVRAELESVIGALERLHRDLTPSPASGVPSAAVRLSDMFNGWERLANAASLPAGLDDWSRQHLTRLVELESQWIDASAGETLLHCDIRSDNVLMRDAGGAVFVDWPHAAVGAPVLDMVCWAPSVVLEGGPEPDQLLARHALCRAADPEVVTALVAAVAGFLVERSFQPSPPGLPTLRAFQAAQGTVARAWLEQRTGW
jgi:hypothetical protein